MKQGSLGRVGGVSHVSCIDRRIARGTVPQGPYAQLQAFGLARLQELCSLFGTRPVRVMARCGDASEVFLELAGNIHIQYYGTLEATHEEQSLWVEGPRGSLRGSGRWLLWRKRGWPKFAPWGLNGWARSSQADSTALFDAIRQSCEQGRVVSLGR